jgi:dihydroxy-acid dehydratase
LFSGGWRPDYLPIPSRLARAGLKDMVRISDARMSGTAYGTIVQEKCGLEAAGRSPRRGYAKRYMDHVLQAEHGCGFDFLRR